MGDNNHQLNEFNKHLATQKRLLNLMTIHTETPRKNLRLSIWEQIDRAIDKIEILYKNEDVINQEETLLILQCCKMFYITTDQFKTKSRKENIVAARSIFAKIMHDKGYDHHYIALCVNKGRSNVYNMINTANTIIEQNKLTKEKYEQLLFKSK
jgi:hypothetical protein